MSITHRKPSAKATTLFILAALASFGPLQAHASSDIISNVPLQAKPNLPTNLAIFLENSTLTTHTMGNQNMIPNAMGTWDAAVRYRFRPDVQRYAGYFDPDKCYKYLVGTPETSRFVPVDYALRDSGTCESSDGRWSGQFLNWATMHTLDGLRHALTGGYRARDDNNTWLEKTYSLPPATLLDVGAQASYLNEQFPVKTFPGSLAPSELSILDKHTPFDHTIGSIHIATGGLGNEFHIVQDNQAAGKFVISPEHMYHDGDGDRILPDGEVDFDGNTASCYPTKCKLKVRVEVCVSGMLEDNCNEQYANPKPEGLLQKYHDRADYALFSYLNNPLRLARGSVMRSPVKPIGPSLRSAVGGLTNNDAAEWGNDGILKAHPDTLLASQAKSYFGLDFDFEQSGIINFINGFERSFSGDIRFGGNIAGAADLRLSEAYYPITRYFRFPPNVSGSPNPQLDYFFQNGLTTINSLFNAPTLIRQRALGGFPVAVPSNSSTATTSTVWQDPVRHWCQPNVSMMITGNFTANDGVLPGSQRVAVGHSLPAEMVADPMNVHTFAEQIMNFEDIEFAPFPPSLFESTHGTGYLAAQAWYMRSQDIRPDLTDSDNARPVHLTSYFFDIAHHMNLRPWDSNVLALAGKYGGMRTEDWNPTEEEPEFPLELWHNSGLSYTPFSGLTSGVAFKKPDNYFIGFDVRSMKEELTKTFEAITREITPGVGVGLGVSSTRLETDGKAFAAEFGSGEWSGNLSAYTISKETGQLSSTPVWRATSSLPAWEARKIYTNTPGAADGGHALFTKDTLNAGQLTALSVDEVDVGDVVNYLRGDASKEVRNGGTFRNRVTPLGDIVHSQPVFVGAPEKYLYRKATFTGADKYHVFVQNQANRKGAVYVGANDGMLHGFNASTGEEFYSFVPNTVIHNNLKFLTNPTYDHQYFVDGEIAIADVYMGADGWKTVLVGTLGRGGPGLFALDVTGPGAGLDPSDTAIKLLWELNSTDIPELGRNLGKPVIAQTANGKWEVILESGVPAPLASSDADVAITSPKPHLILVDIKTGVSRTIEATGSTAGTPLSGIATWDSNLNGFIDTVYAGDHDGNVWRFNLVTETSSKLFQAKDPLGLPQPITVAPIVASQPNTTNTWVFFGTGRFLNTNDLTDLQVQSWYGLIDGPDLLTRSDLKQRKIVLETTVANYTGGIIEEGTSAELLDKKGWYIDLMLDGQTPAGERMMVPNQLIGGALIGTTRVPDGSDPCDPIGTGFVNAINPFTGGRLDFTFFDFNDDGNFDNSDRYHQGELYINVSRIKFQSSPHRPSFVAGQMHVVTDIGGPETIGYNSGLSALQRTSWREIVGN